ncbi:hypothetical protein JHD48_00805 [Sulfurimonas sp. SAG-AH-194-I05]|nr:PP0621 family protein [Sulfurimonas sp. SAG-AH-194-I05]MDF1874267.1 hypothetical protein [Sulfurimonas sp. SAG-AH-194-I05]
MILKILLVLGVIGIVYFLFIKKKPSIKKNKTKKEVQEDASDLVACTTCGTYSELNETLISANKYYCSDACMEKA